MKAIKINFLFCSLYIFFFVIFQTAGYNNKKKIPYKTNSKITDNEDDDRHLDFAKEKNIYKFFCYKKKIRCGTSNLNY